MNTEYNASLRSTLALGALLLLTAGLTGCGVGLPTSPDIQSTETASASNGRTAGAMRGEFDSNGEVDQAASAESLAWIAAHPEISTLIRREYSKKTPEENLALAERQIESLKSALSAQGVDVTKIRFEAAGSTGHKETPSSAVEVPMFSRVEAVRP